MSPLNWDPDRQKSFRWQIGSHGPTIQGPPLALGGSLAWRAHLEVVVNKLIGIDTYTRDISDLFVALFPNLRLDYSGIIQATGLRWIYVDAAPGASLVYGEMDGRLWLIWDGLNGVELGRGQGDRVPGITWGVWMSFLDEHKKPASAESCCLCGPLVQTNAYQRRMIWKVKQRNYFLLCFLMDCV
jgi:hypothetical protein